jgi:hypothetical protein
MKLVEYYFANDMVCLEESHVAALFKMDNLGEGEQSPEELRFRLPCHETPTLKKIWSNVGKDNRVMPCKIKPLTSEDEKSLVIMMIAELHVKLALDPTPTFERGLGLKSRAKVRVDNLVVVSSNASRLGQALDE